MKLQPDKPDTQVITGYGEGWLRVDADRIEHSIVISSGGARIAWDCDRFESLSADHFMRIADLDAELVVFGSGLKLRFPPPLWLRPLIARRVGVETMDTQAACRTYNILAQEGRTVVAALLLEHAA